MRLSHSNSRSARPSAARRPSASQPAADRVARDATRNTAIEGLDSLASANLLRALDYLQVRPQELGFDKLYADDDFYFIRVPRSYRGALEWVARRASCRVTNCRWPAS